MTAAGVDNVAHHYRPFGDPALGIHWQAGGQVDRLRARNRLLGLCGVEQIGAE